MNHSRFFDDRLVEKTQIFIVDTIARVWPTGITHRSRTGKLHEDQTVH